MGRLRLGEKEEKGHEWRNVEGEGRGERLLTTTAILIEMHPDSQSTDCRSEALSECVLPAMDSERDARVSSSPDNPDLDEQSLDWIEEEAHLICDLATLDAAFDLCNTREARNRLNNDNSYLYSDPLTTPQVTNSHKSILLPKKVEEERKQKRGWSPVIDRNAMAVLCLLVFLLSLFYDAHTHLPALMKHYDDEYRISPDNFVDSNYIIDRSQANHLQYTALGQEYNLIFVYSHMSVRSRKWIKIINKMERMTRYDRRQFGFYTTRCFDTNDSCQQLFGIKPKTPAVILYHKGRYYPYAGRLSIDHVWSWVERMMSPIEIVYDLDDYYKKFLNYDVTFTAYFPFQKSGRSSRVHSLFPSYERIAMERMTGTPDSHRTRFLVVLNQTLAEYLKVDDPGTILFQATLGRYEYLRHGWTEQQLASYIFHWDRASFRVPFMYKGIHPTHRFKIQSNRYFTKITNGTTIIMFTRHDPLYYPGNDDITAFREIALEYNDCDLRPEWQWRAPMKIYHPRRYTAAMDELHSVRQQEMNEDRRVYEKSRRIETIRGCCKDVNNRRSMTSLCSCCHTESGGKMECDIDTCSRSYANSSELFETSTCGLLLEDMSRDDILLECCEILSESQKPGKLPNHEARRRRGLNQQDALRGFLGLSLVNNPINRAGIDAPRNMTLWKYGCKLDNPLRFIIVDTRRSPSLARRLGVNPTTVPRVAIVDAEEERVSFMDWQYSRQSLRHFIASYHTGEADWTPLNNGDFPQHRRNDTGGDGSARNEEGLLKFKELDYDGLTLATDAVLFLTGGVSHAASAVLHFQMLETMQFLLEKNIPVDFFSFDITANDLPYNFKMNRFPSVYFLPADRPLDSFEFPRQLQFTSSNLVYYALACLSDTVRWRVLLGGGFPSEGVARHLRARIEEAERILRRRRRLSRQATKRMTGQLRVNRLLLAYLHRDNSEEDFARVLDSLQQAMSPP